VLATLGIHYAFDAAQPSLGIAAVMSARAGFSRLGYRSIASARPAMCDRSPGNMVTCHRTLVGRAGAGI
jgi:hypothetical protein